LGWITDECRDYGTGKQNSELNCHDNFIADCWYFEDIFFKLSGCIGESPLVWKVGIELYRFVT
jgi:hypothetical protein